MRRVAEVGSSAAARGAPWIARTFILAGALVSSASLLSPVAGEWVLQILRGHRIESPDAIRILPKLLLLVAVLGTTYAGLLVSCGLLLRRSARRTSSAPRNPSDRRSDRWPRASLLAVGAAVLALSSTMALILAGRSFNYDEGIQKALDVDTGFSHAFRARATINHFSGSLLAALGSLMDSRSERVIRLPSLLLALSGLIVAAAVAWRAESGWTSFLFPLIFLGLNGFVVEYSAQIRGYSSLMWGGLLTAIGLGAAVEARLPVELRSRVFLSTATILAALLLGASHLFGLIYLLFMVGLSHCLLWSKEPRARASPNESLAVVAAVTVAVIIPIGLWSPSLPWIFYTAGARSLNDTTTVLARELALLATGSPAIGFGVALLLLLLLAVPVVWTRAPHLRICAVGALVPLAALIVLGLILKPRFLSARFFSCSLPLAAVTLAVASGHAERWIARTTARTAFVLAVLGMALLTVLPGLTTTYTNRRGYREGVQEVKRFLSDGTSVVVLGHEADPLISYYLWPRSVKPVTNVHAWRELSERGCGTVILTIAEDSDPAMTAIPAEIRRRLTPMILGLTGEKQSPLRAWTLGGACHPGPSFTPHLVSSSSWPASAEAPPAGNR